MKDRGGIIGIACFLIFVVSFLSFVVFPKIGDGLFGPKLCKFDGCPNESDGGKYCYLHQCINISCERKREDGFSYCKKCLKKAGYDIDFDE